MATQDDKIVRSGNETWRGAKDSSDAAKSPSAKDGANGREDKTTFDGEDVTKRDAKSVKSERPAK